MPTHVNLRYREIEKLMPGIEAMQELATSYGITDISSDNGLKILQLLIAVGLDYGGTRQGPDGLDRLGGTYEIKTIDIDKAASGFSTNHHLNSVTVSKYRARNWVFAVYRGIKLHEAYLVSPDDLEPTFKKWEHKLKATKKTHLNNPKISLATIREVGEVAYLKDVPPSWVEIPNA